MFKKVTKSLSAKQAESRRKKLEQALMQNFYRHSMQIRDDLVQINISPQLPNAIAMADTFREICSSIGKDKKSFGTFYRFLDLVRKHDRTMEELIDTMKIRFESNNPEKFRVEVKHSPADYSHILSSLQNLLTEFAEEEKERQLNQTQKFQEQEVHNQQKVAKKGTTRSRQTWSSNISLKINNYIRPSASEKLNENTPSKIQKWVQNQVHPTLLPENRALIVQYRSKMTEKEKTAIQQPLTSSQEVNIAKRVCNEIMQKLRSFETQAYYSHVITFGETWLSFLEQTSSSLSEEVYVQDAIFPIRQTLRENYQELEEWLSRVEVKYENVTKRNSKEPKVEAKEKLQILQVYDESRKENIRHEEDLRILQILKLKERERVKQLQEKEKAEAKVLREQNREKAKQLREKERAKNKILKNQEKKKTAELREERKIADQGLKAQKKKEKEASDLLKAQEKQKAAELKEKERAKNKILKEQEKIKTTKLREEQKKAEQDLKEQKKQEKLELMKLREKENEKATQNNKKTEIKEGKKNA